MCDLVDNLTNIPRRHMNQQFLINGGTCLKPSTNTDDEGRITDMTLAGTVTDHWARDVLLGGNHCGGLSTAAAVASNMCDILASDYYYPSILHADFALAQLDVCSLAAAWGLVSAPPAQALRLSDRGLVAAGRRAGLLLVQAPANGADGATPRLIATNAAGRLAYCAEPERLSLRQLGAA